jgi:hypothetical protein
VAQQGSPPRRSARLSARGRRSGVDDSGYPDRESGRPRKDSRSRPSPRYSDPYYDDDDQDPPPWAGPSIYPAGPGRKERRPPGPDETGPQTGPQAGPGDRSGGRAAATRARRSKRRVYALGGLAVALIIVALGATGQLPFLGGSPAASSRSDLVTTFQPGDVRSVPSACQAVSTATLGQYLPGKRTRAIIQSLHMESQCTWTLDQRPVYRVLEVTTQAFGPSLLATGNGSATFSAIDAYDTQLQAMKNPPKSAHRPKARLGAPRGLGNAAFSALQVWRNSGSTTDFVTVVTRQRNVVITVTLQGLDSAAGGHYGPVSVPTLQAGALAAAHEALAAIA